MAAMESTKILAIIQAGGAGGRMDVQLDDPDAIPVVGRDSRVSTSLAAGARLAPGTTS